MSIESALRAREMFPETAFDPYEEAEPVRTCRACGEAIYDGERMFFDVVSGAQIGCEHCIEIKLA